MEQITGALRRTVEGTHGRCEECGTAIQVERLEVLPHLEGAGLAAQSLLRHPALS